jgi:hypothetical protein
LAADRSLEQIGSCGDDFGVDPASWSDDLGQRPFSLIPFMSQQLELHQIIGAVVRQVGLGKDGLDTCRAEARLDQPVDVCWA